MAVVPESILGSDFYAEMNRMINSVQPATFNVADVVIERIRMRTLAGMSSTGQPFAPYSEKHASKKGSARVDLRGNTLVSHHGGPHMMDQMHTRSGEGMRFNVEAERFIPASGSGTFLPFDSVHVEIHMGEQARERARTHQYGRPDKNIPPRPFMGLSPSEEGVVGEVFGKAVYQPKNTTNTITYKLF